MKKLARLEKLKPRKIWKHEALDFTRWLAEKENIDLLCEELGINIENVRTEAAAGRYAVDIVADDIDRNAKVIIENQLESTDHKHLGQILTYASAFDASIIVWVVTDFTEEHKQAIDWFNRHMPEEINFFLVLTEVYKIGDSDPAPHFTVVCEPNQWGKALVKSATGDSVSNLKLQQQQFWEGLKEYAEDANLSLNLGQKSRPQHWYNISFGTSRCHIVLRLNSQKKYISCEIYIGNDPQLFEELNSNKGAIEAEIGESLNWMELPKATASRIQLVIACDPMEQEQWPKYFEWCATYVQKFSTAFIKHV